jgi:hypothetical protein
MRAAWILALVLSLPSGVGAANIDAAEAWRPMRPFMGTWRGTRNGDDKPVKVTRQFASAATNRHLEITEKGSGRPGNVWGIVSFDRERQLLVLRQFGADGSTSDASFDPTAAGAGPVVFASAESEPTRTRITYQVVDAKSFVERIERAAGGEPYALVAETRFVRKD